MQRYPSRANTSWRMCSGTWRCGSRCVSGTWRLAETVGVWPEGRVRRATGVGRGWGRTVLVWVRGEGATLRRLGGRGGAAVASLGSASTAPRTAPAVRRSTDRWRFMTSSVRRRCDAPVVNDVAGVVRRSGEALRRSERSRSGRCVVLRRCHW